MRGRRRKRSHYPIQLQAWCHRRRRMGGQRTRFLGPRIGSTRWSNFVRSIALLLNPLLLAWFKVNKWLSAHKLIKAIYGNRLTYTKKTGPWNGHSSGIFLTLKPEEISKCGNDTICTYWKNKHFLFYAQECCTKIEPATPSWKLNFKWPLISQFLS